MMEAPYVNIHTHRPTGRAIEPQGVGIHPWEAAGTTTPPAEEALREAPLVGEIGLDFLRGGDRAAQLRLFRAQLDLAERLRKPVVIHCVRAFNEVMAALRGYTLPAVLLHGFIGSPEQAAEAVRRGCCLSFGPQFVRSPRTVEALRTLPADRLFAETDDDPTPIEEVYRLIAAVRKCDVGELRRTIYANYQRIFNA